MVIKIFIFCTCFKLKLFLIRHLIFWIQNNLLVILLLILMFVELLMNNLLVFLKVLINRFLAILLNIWICPSKEFLLNSQGIFLIYFFRYWVLLLNNNVLLGLLSAFTFLSLHCGHFLSKDFDRLDLVKLFSLRDHFLNLNFRLRFFWFNLLNLLDFIWILIYIMYIFWIIIFLKISNACFEWNFAWFFKKWNDKVLSGMALWY